MYCKLAGAKVAKHKKNKFGYCNYCRRKVKLIPILYSLPASDKELDKIVKIEKKGKCIISDDPVAAKHANYVCALCGSGLPQYGTLQKQKCCRLRNST